MHLETARQSVVNQGHKPNLHSDHIISSCLTESSLCPTMYRVSVHCGREGRPSKRETMEQAGPRVFLRVHLATSEKVEHDDDACQRVPHSGCSAAQAQTQQGTASAYKYHDGKHAQLDSNCALTLPPAFERCMALWMFSKIPVYTAKLGDGQSAWSMLVEISFVDVFQDTCIHCKTGRSSISLVMLVEISLRIPMMY